MCVHGGGLSFSCKCSGVLVTGLKTFIHSFCCFNMDRKEKATETLWRGCPCPFGHIKRRLNSHKGSEVVFRIKASVLVSLTIEAYFIIVYLNSLIWLF